MASFRTPMDKPYAVKPVKSVRRGQPKITVPSLRDRVDKCGRDPVFVGPDCVRVLRQRLVGIARLGLQRQQTPAHSRAERTHQTTAKGEHMPRSYTDPAGLLYQFH